MGEPFISFRTEPRKQYQSAFVYATLTKSTLPYAFLRHSDEEERQLFFLSRGYFIKEGKTKKALKIIIKQFKIDYEVLFDFNLYTTTIPAAYIEGENREFFLQMFNREGILKTVLDFHPNYILEIKKVLHSNVKLDAEQTVLTRKNIKKAETAALITWVSDSALSIVGS